MKIIDSVEDLNPPEERITLFGYCTYTYNRGKSSKLHFLPDLSMENSGAKLEHNVWSVAVEDFSKTTPIIESSYEKTEK